MELHLDVEDEVNDFLQAQRPNWPNQPTPCPVFACGEQEYNSWSSFNRHWNQKHSESITQFACCMCKKLFYRLHAYTAHQRKVHNVPNPVKDGVQVRNEHYINPGGVPPFKMDFRSKVAQKRQQMETPGEALVSTETVCRDEEFNGQEVVFKSKK